MVREDGSQESFPGRKMARVGQRTGVLAGVWPGQHSGGWGGGQQYSETPSREPRWGPRDISRISLDTALDPGVGRAGAGAGAPRLGSSV